jgi:hypothetical protein
MKYSPMRPSALWRMPEVSTPTLFKYPMQASPKSFLGNAVINPARLPIMEMDAATFASAPPNVKLSAPGITCFKR